MAKASFRNPRLDPQEIVVRSTLVHRPGTAGNVTDMRGSFGPCKAAQGGSTDVAGIGEPIVRRGGAEELEVGEAVRAMNRGEGGVAGPEADAGAGRRVGAQASLAQVVEPGSPRAATLAATVAGGPETVAVAPSTSVAVTSTG